jgi:hypothetical protein
MNLKRWTLCLLRGHPMGHDSLSGQRGHRLLPPVQACRYENHNGTSVRPTGVGL